MVFVPPLAASLDDLKNRITAAVNSLDEDTLRSVWDEFNYHLDVVCASGGGHIEHLQHGLQLTLHNLLHHLLCFIIATPCFPLQNCFG